MILLRLYFEFAKTGLFAVGGGLATIPFLREMGERTGWFTDTDITTMLAVAESTPGPMGINMATYVGFQTAGPLGSILATLGLITPPICIIIFVAGFLQKFRQSKAVNAVFQGLRPASTALIVSASLSVASAVFFTVGGTTEHSIQINWISIALAVILFFVMRLKSMKKLHPVAFIGIAAMLGILLQL